MKTSKKANSAGIVATPIVALLLGALWVSGCHSAGYHKSEAAANSLQTASDEIQAESRALELTMGSLKDLVNSHQVDLKVQYKHFSGALDDFVSATRRAEATGRRMGQKNAEYLEAWDKQIATINYEAVRNQAIVRRNEVADHVKALSQRYADTHAVVEPLISYLTDIRTTLGSDLTPGGLESVKRIVSNADDNSGKVQTALAKLADQLANSSTGMSPMVLESANARQH